MSQYDPYMDYLAEKIYDKIFFSKLAHYGIVPRNKVERLQLSVLPYMIRSACSGVLGDIDTAPPPYLKLAARILLKENPAIKKAARVVLRRQ